MIYTVKNEDEWFEEGTDYHVAGDLTFITEEEVNGQIISIERLHLGDLEMVSSNDSFYDVVNLKNNFVIKEDKAYLPIIFSELEEALEYIKVNYAIEVELAKATEMALSVEKHFKHIYHEDFSEEFDLTSSTDRYYAHKSIDDLIKEHEHFHSDKLHFLHEVISRQIKFSEGIDLGDVTLSIECK